MSVQGAGGQAGKRTSAQNAEGARALFPLAGCQLLITVEDGNYLKAYASPADGAAHPIISYGLQGRIRDEVCDGVRKLVDEYLEANRPANEVSAPVRALPERTSSMGSADTGARERLREQAEALASTLSLRALRPREAEDAVNLILALAAGVGVPPDEDLGSGLVQRTDEIRAKSGTLAVDANRPGDATNAPGHDTGEVTPMRDKRTPCPGSGRRTTATGSSAFPEVLCPCCGYEARPVTKHGETLIRSHRAVTRG